MKKFKKERRLCRFAGILFLVLNSFASLGFIGSINKDPSEIFLKMPWLILIYAIYAIYRFISGYLLLDKARRSWSLYREIFANLSYFEGLITLFNVEVLVMGVFSYIPPDWELVISEMSGVAIIIISFVMALKMIKSRRPPNLIQ